MSSPFSKNFINKKSSLFMTQKQEDTFGPEGSNPNPEIYKGIQENETSPLEYSKQVATGYVSTRGSFQDMFDKISAGTVKAIEGLRDPETQANRLQDRIDSRQARAYKKGKATTYNDDGTVNVQGSVKRTEFDDDTEKIEKRQKTYQDRADKDVQKRIEQARALRSASTKYSEGFGENAKAGYDSIFGDGAWDKATEEEKRNFIK